MKYGLSDTQLAEIIAFIKRYPAVEEAVLFGSRAIDTYKEASDIDIAIKGEKVTAGLAATIKFDLEEDTYLPFFFDVIAYPTLTNEALIKHIDTQGVRLLGGCEAGEWVEVSLSSVAQINPSETLKKGIKAKKITMDDIKPFTRKPNSFSEDEFNGGTKFRNGDTLVARITPCLENGKTAYIDILEDNEVGFGSTEYIVLREKHGLSDKLFLYYFAISPIFRDVAILSMTGSSGRQRVQTEVIKEYLFNIPPLPEQKAIANVLSSLDDKIDLLHRQNKTLEAMAETLFRQWFIEEAKEDWEEVKLGELFEISSGKGINKDKIDEMGIYPILGANGEIGRTNDFLFKEKLLFTGRVGTLGNIFIVNNKKVWLSDNTLIFRKIKHYYFIYFTLKGAQLSDYNAGSTQPLIRQSDIKEIPISLPDSKKLNIFEYQAHQYFKKIEGNSKQIQTLEKLRDTLLPKLMSGEVRVAYHSPTAG